MSDYSKELQHETSLGPLIVQARVVAGCASPESLSLKSADIQPTLPVGMRVDRCRAVLVRLTGTQGPFQLQFSARLISQAKGHPCTGDRLEAIEWSDDRSLIVVGTEDAAALSTRMSGLDIVQDQAIASYDRQAIQIRLSGKQSNDVTFHFIIAENPAPEPTPDGAWFAVDVSHQFVTQQF